jgi:hypothetical protein
VSLFPLRSVRDSQSIPHLLKYGTQKSRNCVRTRDDSDASQLSNKHLPLAITCRIRDDGRFAPFPSCSLHTTMSSRSCSSQAQPWLVQVLSQRKWMVWYCAQCNCICMTIRFLGYCPDHVKHGRLEASMAW